jgi:hypothetical protein
LPDNWKKISEVDAVWRLGGFVHHGFPLSRFTADLVRAWGILRSRRNRILKVSLYLKQCVDMMVSAVSTSSTDAVAVADPAAVVK